MAKMHTGTFVKKAQLKETIVTASPTIIYIDKIVEVPVEVIKEIEKVVQVETECKRDHASTIEYVDRIVEVPVEVVREVEKIVHNVIEVPVQIENIEKLREIQMKHDKLVKKNLILVYIAFTAIVVALVMAGK